MVTIAKRGEPIPEAEWERIFEPFERRDAAREGPAGWGVGLTYALSVARAHGGSLRVASSWSEGTEFELTLPVDSRSWLEPQPH